MASNLARKNFMVDAGEIRILKKVLGAASESEAIRVAVHERIMLGRAEAALRRIRARRGVTDVYRRASGAVARKRKP